VQQANLVAKALLQALETLRGIGEMLGAFGFGFLDQRTGPLSPLAGLECPADAVDRLVEAARR